VNNCLAKSLKQLVIKRVFDVQQTITWLILNDGAMFISIPSMTRYKIIKRAARELNM